MELKDITIESVKKLSVKDGDVVIVTLPLNPNSADPPARFRFLNTVDNEFRTVLSKLGYTCEVVVLELEQPMGIEVLSKKEFKKKGSSMNWIESKWSWYKALPWYWKILAGVLGIGIILLLVLSLIGRSKPPVSEVSEAAHNDMVSELVEEKIQIDEDLKKEIEESKLKIEEVVKEEKLVDEKADEMKAKINNATSVNEVRKILKELSQ